MEEASICKQTILRTEARSQQQEAKGESTFRRATRTYALKEGAEDTDASEWTSPRIQILETLYHIPLQGILFDWRAMYPVVLFISFP